MNQHSYSLYTEYLPHTMCNLLKFTFFFLHLFWFSLNTLDSFSICSNVSHILSSLLARNYEVIVYYAVSKSINCCRKTQHLLLVISGEMSLQLFVSLMLLYTLLPGWLTVMKIKQQRKDKCQETENKGNCLNSTRSCNGPQTPSEDDEYDNLNTNEFQRILPCCSHLCLFTWFQ